MEQGLQWFRHRDVNIDVDFDNNLFYENDGESNYNDKSNSKESCRDSESIDYS